MANKDLNQRAGDANKAAAQADSEEPSQPEEAFWARYSPHHEFPLSTVSSIALCGTVLGLLMLLAFWDGLRQRDETRPVSLDEVEIAGGGGTDGPGPQGAGREATGSAEKAENVKDVANPKPQVNKTEIAKQKFETVKAERLKVDNPSHVQATTNDEAVFDAVKATAEAEVQKAIQMAAASASGPAGKKGVRNPGEGGGSGGGRDKGVGEKQGPGGGTADKGVLMSKRQKRQRRWKIDFSGTGEEHLAKLRALGIALAVPTARPDMFMLMDLTRTPPLGKLDNLSRYADKIKWFNVTPPSLRELARVLHLQGVPRYAVIFLPEAMEDELQQLEHDYRGLDESQIEMTEFEIRRRDDGTVGPVVVAQTPKRF
jgi:hypothetical protein